MLIEQEVWHKGGADDDDVRRSLFSYFASDDDF
jgi:hypothetical protein